MRFLSVTPVAHASFIILTGLQFLIDFLNFCFRFWKLFMPFFSFVHEGLGATTFPTILGMDIGDGYMYFQKKCLNQPLLF